MILARKFKTESKEAFWSLNHRGFLAQEFERTSLSFAPSRSLRKLAKLRGVSVEEVQVTRRAAGSRSLPKFPPSA